MNPPSPYTLVFQWAPTLGGECYQMTDLEGAIKVLEEFQWAPTLGGECYFWYEGTWI